jgi:hypothetical protein
MKKPPILYLMNKPNEDMSRRSSGSIVSDCGLDDWAIEVRSPVEAKDFSCTLRVQTGSEAHPASCTVDTGVLYPGGCSGPVTADRINSNSQTQRERYGRF